MLTGLLAAAGVQIPVVLPVWLALGLALIGFLLPDRRLRAAARARRASIRYAVGALLNLVAINLAGGAEVEQALYNALRISHGWAFTLLRNTIRRAQLHREKLWEALGRLGEELDVDDLVVATAQREVGGARVPSLVTHRRQLEAQPLQLCGGTFTEQRVVRLTGGRGDAWSVGWPTAARTERGTSSAATAAP